jgi:hypothetical protein
VSGYPTGLARFPIDAAELVGPEFTKGENPLSAAMIDMMIAVYSPWIGAAPASMA